MAAYKRPITADDDPRLISMCLECKAPKCDGICEAYRRAWMKLQGIGPAEVPLKPRKPARAKLYKYCGREQTLVEWAQETGIGYTVLYQRMHQYGMTIGEAIAFGKRPAYGALAAWMEGKKRGT